MFLSRVLPFILGVFLLSCASHQYSGGTPVVQMGHLKQVNAVASSTDGRLVLSGSDDGTVKLLAMSTGRIIWTYKEHTHWVSSVVFSPDGRYVLSGTKDVDKNNNGFVEFMELVDSVSTYASKETKGEQTPWLSRKELFGDLPIAVVNQSSPTN